MEDLHILGVDLAKRTFAICGTDKQAYVKFRKKLTRPQFQKTLSELTPCVVAMEACGSAHHWGRVARAAGHEVRSLGSFAGGGEMTLQATCQPVPIEPS